MDWQKHFRTGRTILEEVERASGSCIGGIFLFTRDDHLKSGTTKYAAPRDNVIFEAGYFLETKGKDRVLIIREKGAKMPADLGGHIYVELEDRRKLSTIEARVRDFISRL
jgi:predicted nucleotide-binding protein